jgi:hypothetical protein
MPTAEYWFMCACISVFSLHVKYLNPNKQLNLPRGYGNEGLSARHSAAAIQGKDF